MRKKIGAVLIGLLLAVGITLVVASPAAASYSQCPAGVGCAYVDSNGNGYYFIMPVGAYGTYTCWNFSRLDPVMVNSISSAIAGYGSGLGIYFYLNPNCDTSQGVMRIPHMSHADYFTSTWCSHYNLNCNDNAESFDIEYI